MSPSDDDSPIGANLCRRCQVLGFLDLTRGFNCIKHDYGEYFSKALDIEVHDALPGLPRLDASAVDGCDFCRLLRDTVISENTSREGNIAGSFLEGRDKCAIVIKFKVCWTPPEDDDDDNKMFSSSRITILSATIWEYDEICSESSLDLASDSDDAHCISIEFLLEGCIGKSFPLVR